MFFPFLSPGDSSSWGKAGVAKEGIRFKGERGNKVSRSEEGRKKRGGEGQRRRAVDSFVSVLE